jgi:NAD(P) transhydrogenase subunit alpha
MGAVAIDLELETLEGTGGYAREMTEDRAKRQQQALAPHIAEADVLVTTAAVPGRRAPLLVTAEMVAGMKDGSVVVDLAAETGGNVEARRRKAGVRTASARQSGCWDEGRREHDGRGLLAVVRQEPDEPAAADDQGR